MNALGRLTRIAFALLALGCSVTPRTQVMLIVDGDLGVRADATSVDVRIVGGGEVALERTYRGAELVWPREIAIVPRGNDDARTIEVTITAELAQGGTIVRTARTGFVPGSTRALYLRLESACIGRTCASGQTCIAGGCASDTIDPASLPEYEGFDAGMPMPDGGMPNDGGLDGGVDGGVDGGPPDAGPPTLYPPESVWISGGGGSAQGASGWLGWSLSSDLTTPLLDRPGGGSLTMGYLGSAGE
jgi:hypothetical protein